MEKSKKEELTEEQKVIAIANLNNPDHLILDKNIKLKTLKEKKDDIKITRVTN